MIIHDSGNMDVINSVKKEMSVIGYEFQHAPIIIGGRAMEYYGIRKAGVDADMVITDDDYQRLAKIYPEKLRDAYGDLGVMIERLEIWRSIALLGYDFFNDNAKSVGTIKVVSLDKLLFSRVAAMDVQKYKYDLILLKKYYLKHFHVPSFLEEAETRGNVWRDNYPEANANVMPGC